MQKKALFTGAATALITPMTQNGVDWEALDRLVEFQIENGIPAIVACGTTGEAATLSDDEQLDVIERVVRRAAGRCCVIAGSGSNNTAHAVELTQEACRRGADGVLIVTPYYNKTTQSGLVAHFTALADASSKPVILYNVPSRTGLNALPATYAALADHPMIVGIKEANGNLAAAAETMRLVGDKLALYSGEDALITPTLSIGGSGVISVLSNVLPKETNEICTRFFAGDVKGSASLQLKLLPLVDALFSQTNPIPVKAALHRMGYCQDILRLPLIPMEEPFRAKLYAAMAELGL
ncbi:MAG: 4-hydroxy-tetrahydrodipicolinate synthase [Eubacteriales bacterium]|nr:4-hydroxy-tetrahydrodipicolinate synthase [Eubacteriales bacterium]